MQKDRSAQVWLLVLGAVVTAGWAAGCSDEEKAAAPAPLSRKGESCEIRAHCEEGLACIARTCITSEFVIAETAKECAVIECSIPTDCCPPISSYCKELEQNCQLGEEYYCEMYQSYCACSPSSYACEDGTCRANLTCPNGDGCPSYLTCDTNTGRCVACMSDDECSDDEMCRDGDCITRCKLDSDCPYFNRCNNGECVDSGCLTDRECKAATDNALAFCVEETCYEPCQTNLECGNPESQFDFKACINGRCTYMGCETDKECQLYLGTSGNGQNRQVVCVDKP